MKIRLYNYFRSSTSIRVRVAMALKGLEYEYIALNLRKDEQRASHFLAINPQGLVPALEIDGTILTQSLPIMEYLEERFPDRPLLPKDTSGRARVRALASMIACEIHPLNNLRVLRHIEDVFGADAEAQKAWFTHWAVSTLTPMEQMLAADKRTGRFCHGDEPGLADICLFAQLINNRRFGVDAEQWPTLLRIGAACAELPEFAAGVPDAQPDAL